MELYLSLASLYLNGKVNKDNYPRIKVSKNMDKVLACVPSRLESQRLPRKALEDVCGKPMLQRLVERLQNRSKYIDEICICTVENENNRTLVDLATEWDIGRNMGDEHDVLLNFIEAGEKYGADHLLRVTGDNIFTDPYYIDEMIRAHIEHEADYSRVDGLPVGMTAEIMSMKASVELYENMDAQTRRNSGYLTLYSYDPDHLKVLVMDAKPEHARPHYAVTVDTPADIELIRKIWMAYPGQEYGPDIDQIISWLDHHEAERIEVNENAMIKLPGEVEIPYLEFAADLATRKSRAHFRLKAA